MATQKETQTDRRPLAIRTMGSIGVFRHAGPYGKIAFAHSDANDGTSWGVDDMGGDGVVGRGRE